MLTTDDEFLTTEEIAARLKLNPGHVRDRVTKSKGFPVPHVFVGSRRWLASEIEAWIESRRGAGVPGRGGAKKQRQASV